MGNPLSHILAFIADPRPGIGAQLRAFASGRSPQWPALRRNFLLHHPTCCACGTTDDLEVHHITPFSVDKTKELCPGNLCTLCMKPGFEDHWFVGHCGTSWKDYDKTVRADAAKLLVKRAHPSLLEVVEDCGFGS